MSPLTIEQMFQLWSIGSTAEGDPVKALSVEELLVAHIRSRRPTLIRNARVRGATWAQLGVVTGISAEALRSDYSATIALWESDYPGLVGDIDIYRDAL